MTRANTTHSSLPRGRPWDCPVRVDDPEMMDQPGQDPRELAANLRDIRRVNRFFGGTSTILKYLPILVQHVPRSRPVTMLDLATGSADIPVAIAKWAAMQGRDVEIIASDVSPGMLAEAALQVGRDPRVQFRQFDALAIPLPDRSVDIVLCSLALHHFNAGDARTLLREMDRVARVGFIVNDLGRSRAGYIGAIVMARLTTRNRLTRHDAPLSIRRAFTVEELRSMARELGITGVSVFPTPWFRMVALKVHADPHAHV